MSLGTLERSPPPFFRQGPSALTKVVFFSALALFLMAADSRFTLTQPLRAAMATVLLLVSQQPDRRMEWIGALCVTMLVSAVVLVSAERIQRIIGDRLVVAAERLMGLVLVSVAIEMMLRGVKTFAVQLSAAT